MEKRMKVREEEVREYGTKRSGEKVREIGEEERRKRRKGKVTRIMCGFYILT